jgi:hypothetical protein
VDRAGQIRWLCENEDVPHGAPAVVRAAVTAANQSRWSSVIKTAIATAVVLTLWSGSRPWSQSLRATLTSLSTSVVVCTVLGAVVMVLDDLKAPNRGRRALRECLHARLCPSCCYDLRATQPGGDTFVRCPECGGVWPGPESVDSPVASAGT